MTKLFGTKRSALRTTIFTIGVVAAAATCIRSVAQEKPAAVVLKTHALKGGAYWVEGGRSNTAFIVGDKGVVAFDVQTTPEDAQKELAEIAKITPKPVDAIIVSHADPDHVGGLSAFPAGAPALLHENTKAEIRAAAADPNAPPLYGAMYKQLLTLLPKRTIGASETMVLDGVRIVLMYIAPAHTGGDLVAYLPDQKIVLAGDIITTNTGRYPVIHYASGGSSLGWIASMKALLALDVETYVPGHGAIETKAMLQARLRDAEQRREEIKALVNDNKSLAEVKQALPETGYNPMFPTFTETTYDELTKGYPQPAPPWANLAHH